MRKGIILTTAAFVSWGLLPIYWKLLSDVPALEILSNRMVWSFLFLLVVLLVRRQWGWVKPAVRERRVMLTFLASALLLAVNWFVFIWAVNANFLVETSLGYFINPLVSVLLGLLILGERLRPWQWVAVFSAAAGVLYLTFSYGALPWIGLTLAITFGFYGLLRKTAALGALEGLSLETALLFLPALAYILFLGKQGSSSFGVGDWTTSLLLAGAGVVTAVPLLWFSAGARLIPLTMVGLLQYIGPTLQLLLGVLVYGEPFPKSQLIGFSMIWLALIIYSLDGVRRIRRRPRQVAAGS